MKTAVEWLVEQFEKYYVFRDLKNTIVYQQAKEMESGQSISVITKYHNSLFLLPLKVGEAESIYNHIVDTNEMINKAQIILEEHNIQMLEISDEEITKLTNEHILYNNSKKQWVIEGMKLYREKLKTKIK